MTDMVEGDAAAHESIVARDVYYDPYDVDICADPYPVFRRLREEMPLYYNEQYDFYAVSRYTDVEAGLVDRETYISGRGAILELIKANVEMPPGVVIFEDPPVHTVHRGRSGARPPPLDADRARNVARNCARACRTVSRAVRPDSGWPIWAVRRGSPGSEW